MVFPMVFPTSSLTLHANVLSHEASKPTVDGALAKEDAPENHGSRHSGRKKKIEKARRNQEKKTIFTGSGAEKSKKVRGFEAHLTDFWWSYLGLASWGPINQMSDPNFAFMGGRTVSKETEVLAEAK
ncbi:hypothetical protein B0H14DRAFT_2562187 [Mycena olivaceomarginata]|nr:hypothetical protein B0H14DRAFT_2562187 [Mycena olivaceomarginata]